MNRNQTQQAKGFKNCPILGVGIGLRHSLLEETLNATDTIDWLEITPENYMAKGGRSLRIIQEAKKCYPLVSHGVSLSIGSKDPWDQKYLDDLEGLFEIINPPWFSDHLCFSGISGVYFNDLMPLPRTPETVSYIVDRIHSLHDRFQRPFLIENISYYLEYPEQFYTDADFLSAILEKSDCGLLLDVNNVYVNAQNHQFDPLDFLKNLPLKRVVQLHVAGHTEYDDGIVDTHGNAVCEDVWSLLEWTLQHTKPCGVLLERDLNIPPFAELELELKRIREIWHKTQVPLRTEGSLYATL